MMRFGVNCPNFGPTGDARLLAELAHEAEDHGWDGFFLWDHIGADWGPTPFTDPFVALSAMAMTTSKIVLGALVTPIPRRRPWKVAREAVALDRLTGGRFILGVGLGSDIGQEFSCYGESSDDKLHGEMLDEALDIITGLWSGESYSFKGAHYAVDGARYLPVPVQRPRIPIWVAATWPKKKPIRRAARWDGICPIVDDNEMSPDQLREAMEFLRPLLAPDKPFDVLVAGRRPGKDPEAELARVAAFRDAGATWWQEGLYPGDDLDYIRTQIRKGPPHLNSM